MNRENFRLQQLTDPQVLTITGFEPYDGEWVRRDCVRAAKWQRVEPGTVIPAGQPYRIEYKQIHHAIEDVQKRESLTVVYQEEHSGFFIDSSWKPPLVLPTEPTWGIATHSGHTGMWFDRWQRKGDRLLGDNGNLTVEILDDFIPLTDEQVARIEAAR